MIWRDEFCRGKLNTYFKRIFQSKEIETLRFQPFHPKENISEALRLRGFVLVSRSETNAICSKSSEHEIAFP